MLKDPFFKKSFIVLVCVWALDYIGATYGFFETLWWYDVLMHFLGGLWLGLAGIWIYNTQSFVRNLLKGNSAMIIALFATLLGGLLWELFEFKAGLVHPVFMPYPLDTAKDLCMDTLGGILAGWHAVRFKKQRNEH